MSWLLPLLNNLNYWTVLLLMFIEGSVIPAPSELIVPPAAYRAAAGDLNIVLVVLVATIGAVLGSTANYFAAYYLGRPVIYRFANSKLGHLCLLTKKRLRKQKNTSTTTVLSPHSQADSYLAYDRLFPSLLVFQR